MPRRCPLPDPPPTPPQVVFPQLGLPIGVPTYQGHPVAVANSVLGLVPWASSGSSGSLGFLGFPRASSGLPPWVPWQDPLPGCPKKIAFSIAQYSPKKNLRHCLSIAFSIA